MDKIKLKINIRDYLCHSPNKNIRLYDNQENQWVTAKDFDRTPYRLVMSDFKLIPNSNINPYNPINKLKVNTNEIRLTYNNIRTLYNTLLEYQDFKIFICTECEELTTEQKINYISLRDKYYYYDGDFLLIYTYNIISDPNSDKRGRYFPLTINVGEESFLNYVLLNYPDYLGHSAPHNLVDLLMGNDINLFYDTYIESEDKVGELVTLFNNYFSANNPPTDIRAKGEEIRLNVISTVHKLLLDYYDLVGRSCIRKDIPIFEDYEYYDSTNLRIPLLLSETTSNVGSFTNAIQDWVEGKRYFVNDVVYYNNKSYKLSYVLTPTGEIDTTDILYIQGFFSGAYNSIENQIYFDDFNVDANGFTTSLKMSPDGRHFTHWKRHFDLRDNTVLTGAEIGSRLDGLRSFRKNGTETFFDPERTFQEGLKFNQELIFDEDENLIEEYSSRIVSISDTPIEIEPGHDVVEYEYVMDEHYDHVNDVVKDIGIKFVDRFHRYKIGDEYIYNYDEQSHVTYNNNALHIQDEKFNNSILISRGYEFGINLEPTVNDNVSVDRGINRAFEKHLKLGEIKSLEQMINYANGSFFTINNV